MPQHCPSHIGEEVHRKRDKPEENDWHQKIKAIVKKNPNAKLRNSSISFLHILFVITIPAHI